MGKKSTVHLDALQIKAIFGIAKDSYGGGSCGISSPLSLELTLPSWKLFSWKAIEWEFIRFVQIILSFCLTTYSDCQQVLSDWSHPLVWDQLSFSSSGCQFLLVRAGSFGEGVQLFLFRATPEESMWQVGVRNNYKESPGLPKNSRRVWAIGIIRLVATCTLRGILKDDRNIHPLFTNLLPLNEIQWMLDIAEKIGHHSFVR